MAFCDVLVKVIVWLWRYVGGWGFYVEVVRVFWLCPCMGRVVGALVLPFVVPFHSVRYLCLWLLSGLYTFVLLWS